MAVAAAAAVALQVLSYLEFELSPDLIRVHAVHEQLGEEAHILRAGCFNCGGEGRVC